MMQPRSSIAAPQRDSSESLFEETELGLSSRWGEVKNPNNEGLVQG